MFGHIGPIDVSIIQLGYDIVSSSTYHVVAMTWEMAKQGLRGLQVVLEVRLSVWAHCGY